LICGCCDNFAHFRTVDSLIAIPGLLSNFSMIVGFAPSNADTKAPPISQKRQLTTKALLCCEIEKPFPPIRSNVKLWKTGVDASRAAIPNVSQPDTRQSKMTGFEVIPETMIAGNVKPVNIVTRSCAFEWLFPSCGPGHVPDSLLPGGGPVGHSGLLFVRHGLGNILIDMFAFRAHACGLLRYIFHGTHLSMGLDSERKNRSAVNLGGATD
jgi:hypothetical protein